MTRRQEKLNRQLMEIFGTALQGEIQDPRLQMISLTRIKVNRDASHAMIYFVSDDEDYTPQEQEAAFKRAKGFLRGLIADTLDLRYTPDLGFRYDPSIEENERINDLFEQIAQERALNPPQFDEESYD